MSTTTLSSTLSSSAASVRLNRNTSYHSTRVADSITCVHSLISRWDPQTSVSSCFLRATTHLHSYLLHVSRSASRSAHHELIRTNFILQSAMSRLDQELKNHLMSITDAHSTPEAISTVRSIVETMISTGYGEECLGTYQSIRRSAVTSQLTEFGFDLSTYLSKKLRKLKWDKLEIMIKSWIDAAPVAFRSIFSNERQLSDIIFGSSSESVHNAVFGSIICDTATKLLSFPESVAIHVRRSPEKLFRLLNIYDALSEILPDIESVFKSLPASEVQQKAISSLTKLSDAVQGTLSDMEKAIQKNGVNPRIVAPGGALLPLTRYMMNYLISLSDYEHSLNAIESNMTPDPTKYNSSSFEPSDNLHDSPASIKIARLLLVLIQKLESKAESYRDNSLSYLFLTNNVSYMINKVETSRLNNILGEEWVVAHMWKVRRYVEGHLRSGWASVYAALPVKEKEAVARIQRFETIFQKVLKEREGWVVVDAAKREEIRLLVLCTKPNWAVAQRGPYGHGNKRGA
ncbi:exocyst subunit exo70 family protein H7 [Rhynchospora pubera]|uniref:Exocyst subunit Exo70 family protein n=1 Tax=Rhynchospora pubera TaxID=906938 RepID=A0AAV8F323_9POAL|nr:exocyst subunit exo70 family protein H7 [Rhynchospora pubera]